MVRKGLYIYIYDFFKGIRFPVWQKGLWGGGELKIQRVASNGTSPAGNMILTPC